MRLSYPLVAVLALVSIDASAAEPAMFPLVDNADVRLVVSRDGWSRQFVDKQTGKDYCKPSPFAIMRKGKNHQMATSAQFDGKRLTLGFGKTGVTAVVKVLAKNRYSILEVESITGEGVESLVFLNLNLNASPDAFTACALALNLKTNVPGLPNPSKRLSATGYSRFGIAGAKVAVVACPQTERRKIIQQIVEDAPELPKSALGGPWAWDASINRGSYLFAGGNVSEQTVDDYIRLARQLGITQLNLYAARYGDWQPYPKTYPRGRASLKAVIDKIHAAGMQAGLHTYSFFLDKKCPYVTPKPDPRLAKDATFTLKSTIDAKTMSVPVLESTVDVSTTVGFFVRNSVTLQIDDELIEFKQVSTKAPYTFQECKRGACGTTPAAHATGAKVHKLKQCFWLFVPDGESSLYAEVATNLAKLCNDVGFDMVYLDALDGSDVIAGSPWSWHYASKFSHLFFRNLKRPVILEASTFPHHLWYVRSRAGAWDHPTRSHKRFIDMHVKANELYHRAFLPAHLGWWCFKHWTGPQGERTFPDDIEYLCCKAIASGDGLSIQGVSPANFDTIPAWSQLAAITRRYENLRHTDYFSDAVKQKLHTPGSEFTLEQTDNEQWRFRQVQYAKHKVECLEPWSSQWQINNPFGTQPVQLRIEALMGVAPYNSSDGSVIAKFTDTEEFPERVVKLSWNPAGRRPPKGVTVDLFPSTDRVQVGKSSGRFSASNTRSTRHQAWAMVGKIFSPTLDLHARPAMGVWIHGDGKGEVLNVQRRSPMHLTRAYDDHYVTIDFDGWRYFELLEPEGERWEDLWWPYGGLYSIYRESVRYANIERLNLLLNNLPANDSATCYLSPIKALPMLKTKLVNPTVTVGGKTIRFPVRLESGSYIEFRSMTDCKVYGPRGELVSTVKPEGAVPTAESGQNEVAFSVMDSAGPRPRAHVWIITRGGLLEEEG